MTLDELSEKYHVSKTTVRRNFNQAKVSIQKNYGVTIEKKGRGANTIYVEVEDGRADSMYLEPKYNVSIDDDSVGLMSMEFLCLLAILWSPNLLVRASYKSFCEYVELEPTQYNMDQVRQALKHLDELDYINYSPDRTNDDYFGAFSLRKKEEEMQVSIQMIKICRRLALENNMKDWVPILKTWMGYNIAYKTQPFTMKQLSKITGMSEYQLRKARKILARNNIAMSYRVNKGYMNCVGSEVNVNAILPDE